MVYAFDHGHRNTGATWTAALETVLARSDCFVAECAHPSPERTRDEQEIYDALADGTLDVHDSAHAVARAYWMHDDEPPNDVDDIAVVTLPDRTFTTDQQHKLHDYRTWLDHPDPPEEVVVEPPRAVDGSAVADPVGADEHADLHTRVYAADVRLRDAVTARLVSDLVAERPGSDRIGAAFGTGHQWPRWLATDVDIDLVNAPADAIDHEFNAVANRAACRNALRAHDALGPALCGAPDRVAETVGPDTAAAQFAALGVELATEPRIPRPVREAAAGFGAALATDDGDPVERVRRAQYAVRHFVGGTASVEAAVEYGDLDPDADPPATPVEALASGLPFPHDEALARVEAAVDAGDLDPHAVGPADVRSLRSAGPLSEEVEPLDLGDPESFVADRTRELREGIERIEELAEPERDAGTGSVSL